MITLSDTYAWLNYLDQTHLTQDLITRLRIEIKEEKLVREEFKTLSDLLLDDTRNLLDTLAFPEMLMEIAYLTEQRGDFEKAKEIFTRANQWYINNSQDHREAVSAWVCGELQWRSKENEHAKANWDRAQKIFAERIKYFIRRRDGAAVNWYLQQEKRMRVEIAKKIEGAHDWLNYTDPVFIDRAIFIKGQQMLEAVRQGKYASAGAIIESLQIQAKKSHDIYVLPQILVSCGLIAHQMQMPDYAVQLIQESVARFKPDSHRHYTARWMLGCVYHEMGDASDRALENWREGLIGYRRLADRAEKKNLQPLANWYSSTIEVMDLAINEVTNQIQV